MRGERSVPGTARDEPTALAARAMHADLGDEQALAVLVRFVAVGGREGEALEAGQIAVIREILLWLRGQDPPA